MADGPWAPPEVNFNALLTIDADHIDFMSGRADCCISARVVQDGGRAVTRWAMVIDTARCIGCGVCTIACKTENTTPGDIWYAPVIEEEVGAYPDARLEYLPVLCNHCEDAPCIKACPTSALGRRDDGIVLADDDACIGSRACMNACPYGALHLFEGRQGEALGPDRRSAPTVPDAGAARRYTAGRSRSARSAPTGSTSGSNMT